MNNLTSTELSYLAALVDGEGFITINKKEHNYMSVAVGITNSYYPVIKWIYSKIGQGSITKTFKEKHKDCYVWRISTHESSDFLFKIKPYLVLKKEQAELALITNILTKSYIHKLKDKLAVQQVQNFLYKRIKDLNRRGRNKNIYKKESISTYS